MRAYISHWYRDSKSVEAHGLKDQKVCDITPEKIIELSKHFDVMLIDSNRTDISNDFEIYIALDKKGKHFRQR